MIITGYRVSTSFLSGYGVIDGDFECEMEAQEYKDKIKTQLLSNADYINECKFNGDDPIKLIDSEVTISDTEMDNEKYKDFEDYNEYN